MSDLPRLDARQLPAADPGAPGLSRPVRAVQFGTGALLRGLVDDAFDRAARDGRWDGRAVAVSQTGSGRGAAFNEQDGLFTIRERGVEGGETVERARVVTAVARALSAQDDWDKVIALARDRAVELVVSNTTEIGLTWDDGDDAQAEPPRSFPAKLAAWLRARQRAADGDDGWGVVVLPTELVEDNGAVLRDLVLRWGDRAGWGSGFVDFVAGCTFADTLVDRIVTGTPPDLAAAERAVGWADPLMTDAEPYRLWAIEGDDALRQRLAFADGEAVVVAGDIGPFRVRKVRLLNAAHTLLVPVALGCGVETVEGAVTDPAVGPFLDRLFEDLVPAVERELAQAGAEPETARPFARSVRDRLANPAVRHELVGIALHQTAKLRARVVPALAHADAPEAVALGVAAYLLLQKAAAGLDGLHFPGLDPSALPADADAGPVREAWQRATSPGDLVRRVLSDAGLWGADLSGGPFEAAVARHLRTAQAEGIPAAVESLLSVPSAR
ncbi:tagaturonate reductase [Rubrivirga sp.]|uniref:tagaturonate reductase n=1 Tax=Rubrivirga sp. TaxID=1885344 RepID=UPI003B518413